MNDGTNRCQVHTVAWRRRDDAPHRISGSKLQALRAALFADEPLCVVCKAEGRVRLAVVRDHIVPLSLAGEDRMTNEGCQGLCHACHDAKSQAERLAALRTGR